MTGTVTDLSFDGALIRAQRFPPQGINVAVRFSFREQGVHLQGTVTTEVIHTGVDGDDFLFGVKFRTDLEKFWIQLTPVIQALLEEVGDTGED